METRLSHMPPWLCHFNHNTLTPIEERLLDFYWFCREYPCGDYNYQLADRIGCSIRTIQRADKKLYELGLIAVAGPWGKHREIRAIRYPSEQIFVAENSRALLSRLSAKMSPTTNMKVNKTLTYGLPVKKLLDAVPSKAGGSDSASRGDSPRTPPSVQGEPGRNHAQISPASRRYLDTEFKRLVRVFTALGYPAERAGNLARIKLEELKKKLDNQKG